MDVEHFNQDLARMQRICEDDFEVEEEGEE